MSGNGRGNMRPTSRSPPFLVVGLLIAMCILAFNYWSVSSKNSELTNQFESLQVDFRSVSDKHLAVEKRASDLSSQGAEYQSMVARLQASATEKDNKVSMLSSALQDMNTQLQEAKSHAQSDIAHLADEKESVLAELNELRNKLVQEQQKEVVCDKSSCRNVVREIMKVVLDTVGKSKVISAFSFQHADVLNMVSDMLMSATDPPPVQPQVPQGNLQAYPQGNEQQTAGQAGPQQGQNYNVGVNPNMGQNPGMGQDTNMGQNPGMGQDTNMGQNPGMGQDTNMGQNPGMGQDTNMGQNPGMGQNPNTGESPAGGQNPDMGQTQDTARDPNMGQNPGMDQTFNVGQTPDTAQKPSMGHILNMNLGQSPNMGQDPSVVQMQQQPDAQGQAVTGQEEGGKEQQQLIGVLNQPPQSADSNSPQTVVPQLPGKGEEPREQDKGGEQEIVAQNIPQVDGGEEAAVAHNANQPLQDLNAAPAQEDVGDDGDRMDLPEDDMDKQAKANEGAGGLDSMEDNFHNQLQELSKNQEQPANNLEADVNREDPEGPDSHMVQNDQVDVDGNVEERPPLDKLDVDGKMDEDRIFGGRDDLEDMAH
ncbi:uncharacterized protein LOC143296880 [Babylonia areolata]|uniref:uncharacterized protein LOC143296880 n=1 Tax=Babylonia areolata TaxID=304850 RepID=UPI003FD2BCAD